MMKIVIARVSLAIIGITLVALVFHYEIDGTPGLITSTLGVLFIMFSLTLRGIVKLISEIL